MNGIVQKANEDKIRRKKRNDSVIGILVILRRRWKKFEMKILEIRRRYKPLKIDHRFKLIFMAFIAIYSAHNFEQKYSFQEILS